MTLEVVSPAITILHPPEKLVLEIRLTGRYLNISWSRNGVEIGFSLTNFVHFDEIYFKDNTTLGDLGVYEVGVNIHSGQAPPPKVTFIVIELGMSISFA